MTKYTVRFRVHGTCTVEADSLDAAEEIADSSLFDLSEIDLDDIDISMVHADVEAGDD